MDGNIFVFRREKLRRKRKIRHLKVFFFNWIKKLILKNEPKIQFFDYKFKIISFKKIYF